jgi:hypothetical protein
MFACSCVRACSRFRFRVCFTTHSIIFKCLRVALVQVIEITPSPQVILSVLLELGQQMFRPRTLHSEAADRRKKKESSSLTSLTQVPAPKNTLQISSLSFSLFFSHFSLSLSHFLTFSPRTHNHTRHRFLGFSDFKDPPPLHTHTHTHTHTQPQEHTVTSVCSLAHVRDLSVSLVRSVSGGLQQL